MKSIQRVDISRSKSDAQSILEELGYDHLKLYYDFGKDSQCFALVENDDDAVFVTMNFTGRS